MIGDFITRQHLLRARRILRMSTRFRTALTVSLTRAAFGASWLCYIRVHDRVAVQ
jgi:hypothetical protein